MSDKGFKNGCIEFLYGSGHTPELGHLCLYAKIGDEFRFVTSGADDYIIVNSSFHRCAVTKSADQTINTTTWTSLTFNQEEYDIGGLHDNVTNNTRLTIQEDGEYRIIYHVKHDAMDKSNYESRIYKNGTTMLEGTCDVTIGSKDSAFLTLSSTSYLIPFVASDYIELQIYHDYTGTQDVLSANTFFSIERVY